MMAIRSVGPQEPTRTDVLAQMKYAARATWVLGDYTAVAERELWPLGERVVARARIRTGEDVRAAAEAGTRVAVLTADRSLRASARRLGAAAALDKDGDHEQLLAALRGPRRAGR